MTLSIEWQVGLAAMGTWRLTHLIVEEDGPGGVVVRLRKWLGNGVVGLAMDCFFCSSLWVSAVFASCIARDPGTWILLWFGLSGAACLLQRATGGMRPEPPDPPGLYKPFQSQDGDSHVVLRSTTPDPTIHGIQFRAYPGIRATGPAQSDVAHFSR
jgi:hypothetical protein